MPSRGEGVCLQAADPPHPFTCPKPPPPGPLSGTAIVSAASTTGATLAFLVSRYLARPLVEEKLREYPKFGAVDAAVGREGAKVVLLLRLSPLFPFSL
jgi:uncharacterized membrane protein YdjX (TVP38/TMEM64 family)